MSSASGGPAMAAMPAAPSPPVRLLTFSTLYPNAAQPQHGVFVENRLRHLLASGAATAHVVAPCPWFPLDHPRFKAWSRFARVPRYEVRHGIDIHHPRYALPPKVGMLAAPFSLYLGALPTVRRLRAAGYDFEVIDAHYFYPDGIAAILLGRHFGRPVTITARGTDLNLIPDYALPRRLIRYAADRAAGLITVCAALKDSLVALGVAPERVRVLRNGVDLALFRPQERLAARARLGLTGPTLLSVGALIARKGHDLVIRALPSLPEFDLLIAGEGEERGALEALAQSLGVATRVRFLGPVPHDRLPEIYTAADIMILASSREGWANVLLESMACGTPVVASDVWGTPEVVAGPAAGRLMTERTPESVVEAVRALSAQPPERAATRRYAESFSWDSTTAGQIALFRAIRDQQP